MKAHFSRLHRFLSATLIGGVVVILPAYIFILLVRVLYNFVIKLVNPVSQLLNFPDHIQRWIADLAALGIVIGLFFVVGLMVQTNFGKRLFAFAEENMLKQLPFYSIVSETIQQLIGAKRMPFSKVVLVDVYSNPTRMTGFVVDEHPPTNMLTVFVPTAPNPTNGFIFHVREDQVVYLNVKPEDAIRSVIGVGIGSSMLFEDMYRQLLQKPGDAKAND